MNARIAALKYIEHGLPRQERIALLTLSGRLSLEFTDDVAKFRETLMKVMPTPPRVHFPPATLWAADTWLNGVKSAFLARASHELRTPLNAIVGYSDLLAEQSSGPLPSPYPRFVANIQGGANHLLAMVNDLLDISRIEAGRVDLNLETFQPAEALEEVLSVITPLAKIKSISIENQVPPGMRIRADRTRFKQVLYNLFSNAVKFTAEGGRVWITDASRDGAAGFCVGDTGIGIPESELEAIFDEFHQVAGSGSSAKGTGLGLAIARRLVELHGGAIRVESTVGQGSRFTLSLDPHSLDHPDAVTEE